MPLGVSEDRLNPPVAVVCGVTVARGGNIVVEVGRDEDDVVRCRGKGR